MLHDRKNRGSVMQRQFNLPFQPFKIKGCACQLRGPMMVGEVGLLAPSP
jgi:hypothetical protein